MKNSSHLVAPPPALELHFSHPHLPLFQRPCSQSETFLLFKQGVTFLSGSLILRSGGPGEMLLSFVPSNVHGC